MLQSAIRFLSSRCDHAATDDGQGFNKFDASLGHKLAELSEWTPKQQRAAWQMLRKYRQQLAASGIDYDAIPEPAKPADAPAPKRIAVTTDGKEFRVYFLYDARLVAAVKALPKRSFDSAAKLWKVPATAGNVEPLYKFAQAHEFEISQTALNRMAELVEARQARIEASKAQDAEIEINGLGGTLRPFQKAGVAYALQSQRCFIADEMGLGKTVQALATVHAANSYPAIVVCPASLKLNWQREAQKWLPGRTVAVWNGKADLNQPADVVVINYDVLKKNLAALKALNPQAVIFDESHYAKNHRAQRTEACKDLAKGVKIRLALTGTPVVNRPQELISQLGIIGRLDDMGGFWPFAKRYCRAYQTRFGWDMSGAAHLDELNEKMRACCYIRRNKADVLAELPEKQRSVLPVALNNRREYDKAEANLISWLRERAAEDAAFLASIADLDPEAQRQAKSERANSAAAAAQRAEQLVRIEALKQLAANGKMDAVGEWIESVLDTGEKLIVFAHHTAVVECLAERFNAPAITGQTPIEKRQASVDRFQNDPDCRIIVLNIRAGGVGLTLTAASNVAFVELDWTPAAHDQAEDRAHRIGQTNQVNAWYLLAERTIDEEIYNLIERKRQVVDAATEGGAVEQTGIMSELVAAMQGK